MGLNTFPQNSGTDFSKMELKVANSYAAGITINATSALDIFSLTETNGGTIDDLQAFVDAASGAASIGYRIVVDGVSKDLYTTDTVSARRVLEPGAKNNAASAVTSYTPNKICISSEIPFNSTFKLQAYNLNSTNFTGGTITANIIYHKR